MKQPVGIEFIKNNTAAICRAAFILVIILFALRSIQEAYFTLPSFDGAMNLQVPENLVKYGRYATSYDTIKDFDRRIQSGGPLLFPIYLMFLVFGKSIFSAQLVSSIYLILAAIVIYYVTIVYSNRFFAVVCLLLFILTPYLLEYGHHIYGEIPALFYLLLSLIVLHHLEKNTNSGSFFAFLAGFLYGFSYLTKTVMLIAVPSTIFFFIIDLLFIHRLKKRCYLFMLLGFVLPTVTFECYKIIQISTHAYPVWWENQSYSIIAQIGLMKKYQAATTLYAKIQKHAGEFCEFFRMNTLTMLCFLCIPPITFITKFLYHFMSRKSEKITLTLSILYGTAFTYMVWWISTTPTSRAWPRRIINGYILEEIAFVISLHWLWKYITIKNDKVHFFKKIAGGIVFTVMLFTCLYQCAVNSNYMTFLFSNSQEKLDAERIAKVIEQLPENANIYGVGWWQAPILSFLSNRVFIDFLQHQLPEYPVKLQDAYLVIDYPDALEHVTTTVLSKTKNNLIEKQGYNYLYQVEYISDYSYTNTYRENRIDAMIWLADHVRPTDKIAIAKELQFDLFEQRTLKRKKMYIVARSEQFKKFKPDDLSDTADSHILRKLQRTPKFVYEEPVLVFDFFENNKFKISWPEIIIKEGSEITEKWVADNSVTYAVGYDNIVVQDNAPFYDPLFRESLKPFPLAHINPIKSFSQRVSWHLILYKEPQINIYKF